MIDLLTILNKLESPGNFSAHGTMQSLLPGLYIDHIGEISIRCGVGNISRDEKRAFLQSQSGGVEISFEQR